MSRIPNPYDFPEVWGTFKLSGRDIGIVVSVDGAVRPYEWAVQKGLGTSGAATLYRGEKLAEKIKVVVSAPDRKTFDDLTEIRDYIAAPEGKKPPNFDVENGFLNWNKIKKASIDEIGQPTPGTSNNWHCEFTFIEYKKQKQVPTGPADPAKPGDPPKPKDEAENKMKDLLDQIDKA